MAEPKPGDELRDLSARLLAFQYGDPQTEKRSIGKKVDVYFEYTELGKKKKLFVEAKDHSSNLSRSQVRDIYSDYSGILERNRPSELLIVTRNGISTDAFEYVNVERFDVTHQTIWELEKSILGMDQYIHGLTKIFSEDGLDQYYIESHASKVLYDEEVEESREIQSIGSKFSKH